MSLYVARNVLLPVVVLLSGLVGIAGCERAPTREPLDNAVDFDHVVLISLDTLRADHLGCYGHPYVQSPVIDTFAEESLLFTQHVTAASSTLTSHTSLMTGCYPHTHAIPKNGYVVPDENVMLAEVLKQHGFTTASFIGAFPLDPAFNFNQGFDHVDARYQYAAEQGVRDQAERRADAVNDAVFTWLDQRSKPAEGQRERLFLFLHYFDIHWPYEAPPPYGRMYRNDEHEFGGSLEMISLARRLLAGEDREQGLALTRLLDAEYSAEVSYVDAQLGRLFDALRERGLYERSLIIITSDHGETMHEHFNFFNHGMSVYETEIHTPLIVRFPEGRFGGREVDTLVSNIDVMPSILHWLNIEPLKGIEGVSFAKVVDGALPARGSVFAEATQPWWDERFHSNEAWPNADKYQCVRTQRFKYMRRIPDDQKRYYDLQADPREQVNLLRLKRSEVQAGLSPLQRELEEWAGQIGDLRAKPRTEPVVLQTLESLGYVGGSPVGDEDDLPPDEAVPDEPTAP